MHDLNHLGVIKNDCVGADPDNWAILLMDTLVDEVRLPGLDP